MDAINEERGISLAAWKKRVAYAKKTSDCGDPTTTEAWIAGWEAAVNLLAAALQEEAAMKNMQ